MLRFMCTLIVILVTYAVTICGISYLAIEDEEPVTISPPRKPPTKEQIMRMRCSKFKKVEPMPWNK